MSSERKTIDQISRTLSSFLGTEYIPGRDATGDFKATVAALVNYAVAGGLVKEIDDADYTIQDTDVYTRYVFKNLTADRTLTFPTLADNQGYEFNVINASGSYDVNCSPEGSDYLNDWQQDFPITEKGGEIKFLATAAKWAGTPLNDACIYEVSSETADTGLSVDGSWDDVSGMELLNGIYGKFLLDAKATQYIRNTNNPDGIYSRWGLGTTSGNNAPNINETQPYYFGFGTDNNEAETCRFNQCCYNVHYTSDGSTVYMKAAVESDILNVTTHGMYGATGIPMFIKAKRVY